MPKAKFQIKIDKTKVQGTNTNFPYLFSETCANLPNGFWSKVVDGSGLDIRFYDTDKSTELKREVVLFDSLNKKVEIWVQIPSLSSASDKYIWCTYGGSTRAIDTTVWSDINASAIYHLQGNANDSSGNANNGTVSGATQSTGQIESAYNFVSASSQYISVPDHTTLRCISNFTLSCWVKRGTGGDKVLIARDSDAANSRSYELTFFSGQIAFYVNDGSDIVYGGALNTNWHHVVATHEAGAHMRIYVDGIMATPYDAAPNAAAGTSTLQIGAREYSGSRNFFDGDIDEVRVFKTSVLGLDWIKTEYNNQNAPATFSQCSAETSNTGKLRGLFFG